MSPHREQHCAACFHPPSPHTHLALELLQLELNFYKQWSQSQLPKPKKLVYLYPFLPTTQQAIIPLHISHRRLFGYPFCVGGWAWQPSVDSHFHNGLPLFIWVQPVICSYIFGNSSLSHKKALNPGAKTGIQGLTSSFFVFVVSFPWMELLCNRGSRAVLKGSILSMHVGL